MKQWVATYSDIVSGAFGAACHFRNQQLKQVCWNYVKSGKVLPSVELFLKCLQGIIDVKKPEEVEAMIFVWDKAAGAVVGQSNWGPNIRSRNLMCTAVSQMDKEVSFVQLALIQKKFGLCF